MMLLIMSSTLFAQAPEFQRFNYQAVVRDAGELLTDETFAVRFTIRQNSAVGPIEYRESHIVTTNAYGSFSAVVGDGSPISGDILSLGFATSILFLEVDLDRGSGWVNLGVQQLGSVPMANRALFAEFDDDNQTLSISGQQLSIAGGNSVILPSIWSTSGSNAYRSSGNVGIGTINPEEKAHVVGNLFVQSNFGNMIIGYPNNGNQWRIGTLSGGQDIQFRSKVSGTSTANTRVVFKQNGHVGIGSNTNPDEELVIGSNFGSGWAVPAMTVGGNGELGGGIEIGNDSYQLNLDAGDAFGRARIRADTPSGQGTAEIEMKTDGLAIGVDAGSPGLYMLKVEHSSFGLDINNASSDDDWEIYSSSSGNLLLYANGTNRGSFSGTTGAYTSISDRSMKTNIRPVESILDKVMLLEASRYQYKDNNPSNRESLGFIAQDVKEIFPELVYVATNERNKGLHTMDYSGFGVIAIAAIQEQQAEIEELKKLVRALQSSIENLSK
ncbi:MAG: tail fiber domain-containing protein [Flavobacteriales bacterium]|nr:tail fiber domain-containing protein [Flavobacteriales bacterium]